MGRMEQTLKAEITRLAKKQMRATYLPLARDVRRLGFERLGNRIRAAFASAVNGLIRQKRLGHDGSLIRKA